MLSLHFDAEILYAWLTKACFLEGKEHFENLHFVYLNPTQLKVVLQFLSPNPKQVERIGTVHFVFPNSTQVKDLKHAFCFPNLTQFWKLWNPAFCFPQPHKFFCLLVTPCILLPKRKLPCNTQINPKHELFLLN